MTYNVADFSAFGQFYAAGINDQGEIVGSFTVNYSGIGYIINGADLTTFGLASEPPTGFVDGAVNNSGQFVGTMFTANQIGTSGFITEGTFPGMTIPGFAAHGINNQGTVVGSGIYQSRTITPLNDPQAAPNTTVAMGINDAGTIVGYYKDAAGHAHGFIYQNNTFTTVDDQNGTDTYLTAINDSGTVVGYYYGVAGTFPFFHHGLIYSGGTFTTLDVAQDTQLTGINNNGVILGIGGDPDAHTGFIASQGAISTTPLVYTPDVASLIVWEHEANPYFDGQPPSYSELQTLINFTTDSALR
jgi:probable HAF family extracellular repeat protein